MFALFATCTTKVDGGLSIKAPKLGGGKRTRCISGSYFDSSLLCSTIPPFFTYARGKTPRGVHFPCPSPFFYSRVFSPPAFRLPISCLTPIRKPHRFPAQEKNHFVSFRPRGRKKVVVVKSKNSSNFPLPSSLSESHFPSSLAAHILPRLIFLLDLLLLDLLLPRRFLRVFLPDPR